MPDPKKLSPLQIGLLVALLLFMFGFYIGYTVRLMQVG